MSWDWLIIPFFLSQCVLVYWAVLASDAVSARMAKRAGRRNEVKP
jgi:hypothetical protein